jgi:hypothetical protein
VLGARGAPAAARGCPSDGPRIAGETVSAYTLGHELGGGGMSRVFLAEETRLARTVVVKVLAPERRRAVIVAPRGPAGGRRRVSSSCTADRLS